MSIDNGKETVREAVRDRYAEIAKTGSSCCSTSPCCSPSSAGEEGDEAYLVSLKGLLADGTFDPADEMNLAMARAFFDRAQCF